MREGEEWGQTKERTTTFMVGGHALTDSQTEHSLSLDSLISIVSFTEMSIKVCHENDAQIQKRGGVVKNFSAVIFVWFPLTEKEYSSQQRNL